MVPAPSLIEKFAAVLGVESATVDWFWRSLREAKLVPSGRRGPSGAPADIGVNEAARLVLAFLSGEGARNAASAVARLSGFVRVGADVGFVGTLEDRLADLVLNIDENQRVGRGQIVSSVAVVRNAAGIEWVEIRYFIEVKSPSDTYSGGLDEFNIREVYAAPGAEPLIDDVRATAMFERGCRLHGAALVSLHNTLVA